MARRIVSLVPSATEIVAELIPERQWLVGVTHECDYPPWVRELPKVVRPAHAAILEMTPTDVDVAVTESLRSGGSLYEIDEALLARLDPDLIVTQTLCNVCAASESQVDRALADLRRRPEMIELSPMRLADVLADIVKVGSGIGAIDRASRWKADLERRLQLVRQLDPIVPRPKVLALEWPDPLWSGGHWIPEMIELAGGTCVLGTAGQPSQRVTWEAAREVNPDVLLLMSCGFGVEQNADQVGLLTSRAGWNDLAAARRGAVFAVDANSHFSRSGPRLVDGTELLAEILRGQTPDPDRARRLPR